MKISDGSRLPLCIFACLLFVAVTDATITIPMATMWYHPETYMPRCPAGHTGLGPYYLDCRKYVQCDHGRLWVRDCGPGTGWDSRINACGFLHLIPGCQDMIARLTGGSSGGVHLVDGGMRLIWNGINMMIVGGQQHSHHHHFGHEHEHHSHGPISVDIYTRSGHNSETNAPSSAAEKH